MMPEVVFVTGASGFVGSHVVAQLLEEGYHVRGTARGAKAEQLKEGFAKYGDRFEVVKVSDISKDQVPEAMKGVDALIHVASPAPGNVGPEELFRIAIEGSLNMIRQAEKAGVRRIVTTSSIGAVRNPNTNTWTDKDWSLRTKEESIATGNNISMYATSKTLAEKAIWEWADAHPHVEVTTFCPPLIFGPLTEPFYLLPSPDFKAITTNLLIFNLIIPHGAFPFNSFQVDVRDVAKAHVLALKSPPTSLVGRKRIIFASPHGVSWKSALQYIGEQRPDLRAGLNAGEPPSDSPDRLPADFARIEQVVGMKKEDFHTFEETLLDTIDSLLKLKSIWERKGFNADIPVYGQTLVV